MYSVVIDCLRCLIRIVTCPCKGRQDPLLKAGFHHEIATWIRRSISEVEGHLRNHYQIPDANARILLLRDRPAKSIHMVFPDSPQLKQSVAELKWETYQHEQTLYYGFELRPAPQINDYNHNQWKTIHVTNPTSGAVSAADLLLQ